MTSAADEQYRGTDPKLLEAASDRMVDNATDFATWLAGLHATGLTVSRVIFPDEVHTSVTPASLSRSLRFAFPLATQTDAP